MKQAEVYILLGGNLGDVSENFVFALRKINVLGEIKKKSAIYSSEPWGMQSKNSFLNQAILLHTHIQPAELLKELKHIEQNFERFTSPTKDVYLDRHLDLDILFYDNQVISLKLLHVPHPKLHERKFTLQPLSEIASEFTHPVMDKTIKELLEMCNDNSEVTRI